MVKEVNWSSRAKIDLFDILEYWKHRNQSSTYSGKLFDLFEQNLNSIKEHPGIGKITYYKGVRLKIVKNYLLVYYFKQEYVYLITIWDSRRDPKQLKKIIKNDTPK